MVWCGGNTRRTSNSLVSARGKNLSAYFLRSPFVLGVSVLVPSLFPSKYAGGGVKHCEKSINAKMNHANKLEQYTVHAWYTFFALFSVFLLSHAAR